MIDDQGNLSGQYRYGPYGEELLATEQAQNPYRFAGYYYDHATELYKAGHRYYDPKSASWTQKDPINQVASPNEGNPYVYAGADPVNRVDPNGTETCTSQTCYPGPEDCSSEASRYYEYPSCVSYRAPSYADAFIGGCVLGGLGTLYAGAAYPPQLYPYIFGTGCVASGTIAVANAG